MFWKNARARYSQLSADDPDLEKWLSISHDFQAWSYGGLGGWIQDFGHRWVAANTEPGRTLEIGFGAGRHRLFYQQDMAEYFISDLLPNSVHSEVWQEMKGRILQCDAQALPFKSNSFHNLISIYNFEHMQNLRGVLDEVHRVLKPDGILLVALPCEGGLLWNIGRELTTRRAMMKQYGLNYDKIIAWEHVWDYLGVYREIMQYGKLTLEKRRFSPLFLPTHNLNLIACLKCRVLK